MDKRAAGLASYYKRELAKYDRRFHNTQGEETGPLVRLLQSFGKLEALVVGPWGNASKDLHQLIRTLAECRVAGRVRARGQEASDWELGQVMGQIRRALSLDAIRAQYLCLLARLCYLGEGAHAAADRRQQAAREEEGRRRDQMAHYMAHIRGRGVSRAGEVFSQN